MQTRIKFIAQGANSLVGGFIAGDILRCGEAIAAHLVECGVAVYMDTVVEQEQPEKRTRKRKEQ